MKSLKAYFGYRVRSTLFETLILCVLALVLVASAFSIHIYEAWDEFGVIVGRYANVDSGVLHTILCILCLLMPLLELSGFKNRRNLDTLLFLPVSRQKMAAAHYLNGLWRTLAIFTLCVLFAFLRALRYTADIHLIAFLPFYLLSLVLGIALYSIFFYLFMIANTSADGIVFEIAWIFAPAVTCLCLGDLLGLRRMENFADRLIFFAPNIGLSQIFENRMEGILHVFDAEDWLSFAFVCLLGAAAMVGYYFTFTRLKAEKVGGISNAPLGYATLVPLYGLLISYALVGQLETFFLPLVAMAIAYFVYRRSFRLKLIDFVFLVITLVFSLLMAAR